MYKIRSRETFDLREICKKKKQSTVQFESKIQVRVVNEMA